MKEYFDEVHRFGDCHCNACWLRKDSYFSKLPREVNDHIRDCFLAGGLGIPQETGYRVGGYGHFCAVLDLITFRPIRRITQKKRPNACLSTMQTPPK